MKTVLPCTREHNFQGFGMSGFGSFRHPFPNLCQSPSKTPQNTKKSKKGSPKGIVFRVGRVLESPFGVLGFRWWFQNRFVMRPGASEATKQHQNGVKTRKTKTPILFNEHRKQHCSHDPVDPSANTFARATS